MTCYFRLFIDQLTEQTLSKKEKGTLCYNLRMNISMIHCDLDISIFCLIFSFWFYVLLQNRRGCSKSKCFGEGWFMFLKVMNLFLLYLFVMIAF